MMQQRTRLAASSMAATALTASNLHRGLASERDSVLAGMQVVPRLRGGVQPLMRREGASLGGSGAGTAGMRAIGVAGIQACS